MLRRDKCDTTHMTLTRDDKLFTFSRNNGTSLLVITGTYHLLTTFVFHKTHKTDTAFVSAYSDDALLFLRTYQTQMMHHNI